MHRRVRAKITSKKLDCVKISDRCYSYTATTPSNPITSFKKKAIEINISGY